MSRRHFQNILSFEDCWGLILHGFQISNKPSRKEMVSTTRAKNLMNTKLTPVYNVSKCLSLKNFYSQKLSKLISAPSLSHHSNTHTTTRINISSLILYLLLSLLQNKSLLSHKQFAQNFCFCVTFPIQHSLEHQTGSL